MQAQCSGLPWWIPHSQSVKATFEAFLVLVFWSFVGLIVHSQDQSPKNQNGRDASEIDASEIEVSGIEVSEIDASEIVQLEIDPAVKNRSSNNASFVAGIFGKSPHRQALERGVALIRKSVDSYPSHRDCFSCHHQAVPLFALRMVAGYPEARDADGKPALFNSHDKERAQRILEFSRKSFERELPKLRAGEELDGRGLTLGYGLWTHDVGDADWGELETAMISNALATQQSDGRWRVHSVRPPAASSDWMATALVVSGLSRNLRYQLHSHKNLEQFRPIVWALHRARLWMIRQPEPATTEDICGAIWLQYELQDSDSINGTLGLLLGLGGHSAGMGGGPPGFGGGRPEDAHPEVRKVLTTLAWKTFLEAELSEKDAALAMDEYHAFQKDFPRHAPDRNRFRKLLLSKQNADGGWGQESGRESDAYSTGVSLILLQETAFYDKLGAFKDSWYQRGIEYLIETQHRDGSWHVSSRAIPVQEYFDNGDPHETDQFISMQATAWAIAALANAHYQQRKPLTSPIRIAVAAPSGPDERSSGPDERSPGPDE